MQYQNSIQATDLFTKFDDFTIGTLFTGRRISQRLQLSKFGQKRAYFKTKSIAIIIRLLVTKCSYIMTNKITKTIICEYFYYFCTLSDWITAILHHTVTGFEPSSYSSFVPYFDHQTGLLTILITHDCNIESDTNFSHLITNDLIKLEHHLLDAHADHHHRYHNHAFN